MTAALAVEPGPRWGTALVLVLAVHAGLAAVLLRPGPPPPAAAPPAAILLDLPAAPSLDLPAAAAKPQPRPDRPLFLTMGADLALHLGDGPVTRDGLGAALDAASGSDREARVFLRADRGVSYGEVVEVMNGLRQAGYLKVALVGLEAVPAAGP